MSKLEQDKQMGKIDLSHLKRKKPQQDDTNQPTQRSNVIQVKSKFDPPEPEAPKSVEKKSKASISLAPVILNKQAVIPPIQKNSNNKQP